MSALIGIGFIVLVVGVIAYFMLTNTAPPSNEVSIVSGSQRGSQEVTAPYVLPLSFNQAEGIVFAYTGWLLVKDYSIGYGERRRIFSKGDAPGLYIDSTSNSLIFAVKTYGTTETILIPDVPAQKWVHFAIVVNQQSVDIYINGMLRQHHTLGQLPDQTDEPIKMGGGWDGVLARLVYHNVSVSASEIKKLAQEQPPDDLTPNPSKPNYFDITWYIGRL